MKKGFKETVRGTLGNIDRRFGNAEDTLLRKFYHNYNKFTGNERMEIRKAVTRGGLSAGLILSGIATGTPVMTALGIGGMGATAGETAMLAVALENYEAKRKKERKARMMKKLKKVV